MTNKSQMSDSHTSGLSGASSPIILIATGPRVYVVIKDFHVLLEVLKNLKKLMDPSLRADLPEMY